MEGHQKFTSGLTYIHSHKHIYTYMYSLFGKINEAAQQLLEVGQVTIAKSCSAQELGRVQTSSVAALACAKPLQDLVFWKILSTICSTFSPP